MDVVDFIQQHEAQDFSNTGDGLQQVQGVGIVLFRGFQERQFEVFEELIINLLYLST